MQIIDVYRQRLQAVRDGLQPLEDYGFAPITHDDDTQSDAHADARYRLLLALQVDRAAGDDVLLVQLLEAEIQRHRMEPFQGLYPALGLACALLADSRSTAHLSLFINAKRANFDTHCGLDVRYLLSAGIHPSYVAAAQLDEELREAFLDYVGPSPSECKISAQSLESWLARLPQAYPPQIVFQSLDAEMDFLLELGEQGLALDKFAQWRTTVFEANPEGWRALLSWARAFNDVPAMIEARQALLAFETEDWGRASALQELASLYLQGGDLQRALANIQALQTFQPHFKAWRPLGMGRFIAELYLNYVLAAQATQPEAAAQVYAWAKFLTQGMKNMHWNLLERLIEVHALYGNAPLATKYRLLLRKERKQLETS